MNCSINANMSNPLLQFPEIKAPFSILRIINQQGSTLVLALLVMIILTILGDFLWA